MAAGREQSLKLSLANYEPSFRRSLFLIILYSIPAWLTFRSTGLVDADVWWHLRTGQWIVQHRWVPYTDSFSRFGMGRPWAAYSWVFEVAIYGLFTRLGLVGLLVYVYALMLAVTAALHSLVRKFEPRLPYSVALTGLALLALAPFYTPRPWLFTILFFILELNILVTVQRSRRYRILLLLLPLFALWANVHIQFVYGLFVLGIVALEDPLDRLLLKGREGREEDKPLPFRTMACVIAGCLIAILVNPYHYRIYAIVWDTLKLGGLYDVISELQALQFRNLTDWLVLLMTLAAAFALGRRGEIRPVWALLLLSGAFLSFRSGRDSWFIVIVAVVIIPSARSAARIAWPRARSTTEAFILVAIVGIVLFTTILSSPLSESDLQRRVAETYPVAAAEFVEQRGYRGPLYNDFDWGGYLIWRLPELPVSIDGRSNLHNAERIKQTLKAWNGESNWSSDPELAAAHVVMAQKNLPLTQLLRLDSRFELVYEDQVAVVFIAKAAR